MSSSPTPQEPGELGLSSINLPRKKCRLRDVTHTLTGQLGLQPHSGGDFRSPPCCPPLPAPRAVALVCCFLEPESGRSPPHCPPCPMAESSMLAVATGYKLGEGRGLCCPGLQTPRLGLQLTHTSILTRQQILLLQSGGHHSSSGEVI
jgi:hypothetical protein